MPSADRFDLQGLADPDKEKEKDVDRDREKGSKSKSAASKAKDLSHVPCKFFKVGSCTAGASCPFSHSLQEAGGQKDVCAWFVKGNCKFGHKCALAHVLPGQSMAMDRKNKKAAQAAAGGSGGGGKEGSRGGRGQRRDGQGATGLNRNPLLSGSTAPTRALQSNSRPPITMPLKATISPSVPAPPLKDTDFVSFGLPDESTQLNAALAQSKAQSTEDAATATGQALGASKSNEIVDESSAPPLPVSTPRRLGGDQVNNTAINFGPIGSPPLSVTSGTSPTRTNGFSPGTSPSHRNYIPSSPFSIPGTQAVFLNYKNEHSSSPSGAGGDFKARSGLAASLGATSTSRAWNADFGPVPSQVHNRPASHNFSKILAGSGGAGGGLEVAVEDEDLEDFLPSSLNDLLTPEERSRRMSRSNSGQPLSAHALNEASRVNASTNVDGVITSSHRYSRSVPAPSLLGDIRSIWSDNSNGLPSSPDTHGNGNHLPGLGSGTPSSYKSTSGFGGRSFTDDNHSPSPSLLSPSNASAAFLPGLHHHYLNSKAKAGNVRSTANTLYPTAGPRDTFSSKTNNFMPSTTLSSSHLHNALGTMNTSTAAHTAGSDAYYAPGRPIPSQNEFGFGFNGTAGRGDGDMIMANALSPSARALQAHAPGQSLPQGLAAGYSRIHALPPPPSIASPGSTGGFSPGYGQSTSPGVNHDWLNNAVQSVNPGASGSAETAAALAANANAGLESMFSRLSYSAAASRTTSTSPNINASPSPGSGLNSPGIQRNVSSGRHWQGQGPLSPLSGPVVTGDDDDLFSMDG